MRNVIEKPQEINDFIAIAAAIVIAHVVICAIGSDYIESLHSTQM